MTNLNRREFLYYTAANAAALSFPPQLWAKEKMPTRPIPKTEEPMPIIGYGSNNAFRNEIENGKEISKELLRIFSDMGGKFIDTGATSERNLGEWLPEFNLTDKFFLASTLPFNGDDHAAVVMQRSLEALKTKVLDMVQVRNMVNLERRWSVMRTWKEAGKLRYMGATASRKTQHDRLEKFIENEKPDFIQVNYSLLETESEQRIIPAAKEHGTAVIINRPFINGKYFGLVKNKKLPEWAAEFDCESWAQFSLKFILGNPDITSVLAETSKPKHALDNLGAAFGRLPDNKTRQRMLNFIQSI